MNYLAHSLAACFLGSLAFVAFVLWHRERAALRRAVEEQQSADTKAIAIRAEVVDALERMNARVVRCERAVLDEEEQAS